MQATHIRKHAGLQPLVRIEIADELSPSDLNDLCDVTDAAIESGGGFGWVVPPARHILERYWKGVLVVPERHLLLARLDGGICGAAQLVEPVRGNEAQAFVSTIQYTFVAPFARGYGAGRRLVGTAEQLAVEMGYTVMQLDLRETQEAAISLYESAGYRRWGVNPAYAQIGGRMLKGFHYSKHIAPPAAVA